MSAALLVYSLHDSGRVTPDAHWVEQAPLSPTVWCRFEARQDGAHFNCGLSELSRTLEMTVIGTGTAILSSPQLRGRLEVTTQTTDGVAPRGAALLRYTNGDVRATYLVAAQPPGPVNSLLIVPTMRLLEDCRAKLGPNADRLEEAVMEDLRRRVGR